MRGVTINVSGAEGSGSSVLIYETPDYEYPWQGACVMHGSFTAGPTSPDSQRIAVVELQMPCFKIRVKANDVGADLRALDRANKEWRESGFSPDKQDLRHRAFDELHAAVFGIAAKHITVKHIEKIVRAGLDAGARAGEKRLRRQFRALLDG